MFFSGIADEAGADLDIQLKAHRELGWNYIELRNIGKERLPGLSPQEFENLVQKLENSNMKVSCYASKIGDWSRKISTDFKSDMEEFTKAVPRLKQLGIPFVRVMSWTNDGWDDKEWKKEACRRLKELCYIAEGNGITLVHENCAGWGGQSVEKTLEMFVTVNSVALKLLFDTGNPPGANQDCWDYYQRTKEHVVYVHLKDALRYHKKGTRPYTFPAEGDGCVRSILADLIQSGYEGGVSIEPHLSSIIHENKNLSPDDQKYQTYIEYGRRLMKVASEMTRIVKG